MAKVGSGQFRYILTLLGITIRARDDTRGASQPMKTVSMLVLSLAACTVAPAQPEDLALKCELTQCECRDPANPWSPAASVVWNQDGTAGCAEGRKLAIAKEKPPTTGLTGGIVLPTYDACATSGPRTGAGNMGQGNRVDCDPW